MSAAVAPSTSTPSPQLLAQSRQSAAQLAAAIATIASSGSRTPQLASGESPGGKGRAPPALDFRGAGSCCGVGGAADHRRPHARSPSPSPPGERRDGAASPASADFAPPSLCCTPSARRAPPPPRRSSRPLLPRVGRGPAPVTTRRSRRRGRATPPVCHRDFGSLGGGELSYAHSLLGERGRAVLLAAGRTAADGTPPPAPPHDYPAIRKGVPPRRLPPFFLGRRSFARR